MKINVALLVAAGIIAGSSVNAVAQTWIPLVTRAANDSTLKRSNPLSDLAWEKARPVIDKEAREGKPYIPWASIPADLPQAEIPAFPGAEGGGKFSFGGRGGKVIVVTSIADSGPGTLREACEQGGARIIVFNVAGIIQLKSPIRVRAPYVTIAGQTAPGDGVCVAGESFWVDTHDVVIRHMRFRRGSTNLGRFDDAVGGNPIGNIILDHVSSSWALDENISMYRHVYDPGDGTAPLKLPTVNITFQNCITSEILTPFNGGHGSTLGGLNSTFIRNLWANNPGRNPSIGMHGDFGYVNNVLFNWYDRTVDGGDFRSMINMINNYYKPGPITPLDKPIRHRILRRETRNTKPEHLQYGRAYVHGNVVEGNAEVSADNWKGGVQVGDGADGGKYIDYIRSYKPFPMAPITLLTAKEAYNYVLDNAGATLPKRDAVDVRIIEGVRTGIIKYKTDSDPNIVDQYGYEGRRLPKDSYKLGVITDISQVWGYPEYKGTPYKDADNDGMPDEWERKYGLNPNDPSDAVKDMNGDGYTNIEKYINNMDPKKKITWKDPKNHSLNPAK